MGTSRADRPASGPASGPAVSPAGGLRRYRLGARLYDVLSLERAVYGSGRRAGIELLRLRPGEHVLDVGCGTGLSFAALREAVTPAGLITGVDASAQMLTRARARVERHGWTGVHLVQADASAPDGPWPDPPADAVLFCYSLSVIPRWREALRNAITAARPGARIAVVDLAVPDTRFAPAALAARIACLAGGSDPERRPWLLLDEVARNVEHRTFRSGHVHVAAGDLSPR